MRVLPLYEPGATPVQIEGTQPLALDAGCTRCALGARAVTRCMSAALVGPEATPLLYVIGQGPTQQEDRTGLPFSGAGGQYVRQLIGARWKGQVLFDNALRCNLGREKIKAKAIEACRPYLAEVWRQAGASRVLLLGREAMLSFLGDGFNPLSVRRGYAYTSTGVPVFLLMPPAMAQRNRFLRGWFEEDLLWALTADPTPPPKDGLVFQVLDEDDFQQALSDLEIAPWVTLDTETYGALANNETCILDAALTPGGQDYAYSFPRESVERFGDRLFRFLRDKRAVGHSLKHDQIVAWRQFGFRPECHADTLWLRRFFECNVELALEDAQTAIGMTGGKHATAWVKLGSAGLRKEATYAEKVASGADLKRSKPPVTDYWHGHPDPARNAAEREQAVTRVRQGDDPARYSYAAIPPTERAQYNALDTVSTDRIYRAYRARRDPDAERAMRVWEEIGRDMQHALMTMEYNGIHADRSKIHELIAWMDRDIAEIESKIEAEYPEAQFGKFNFNSGSPDTARLLFDIRKLPCKQFTPTGRRQCNEEVLDKLDDPIAELIIKWRKRQHFKSQYAEGMLTYIRDDGRVHPGIKGVGTESGRPSSEDPNLFNLPRADAADGSGKACRDIFVADPELILMDDGTVDEWVLVEVDQSQVELRVAGMLSQDQKMIEVFLNDGDIHLAAAIETAPYVKIDPAVVNKEHPHRSNTKAVVFGALYGEPAGALAKKLGISKATAEKLQKLILGHYDQLDRWCREQLAFAKRHGYCFTYWNGKPFRKRFLTDVANQEPGTRETAERSSWNTPIQGTAADYTNASLGAIQRWIEQRWTNPYLASLNGARPEPLPRAVPARLVLTVYDSILVECRKSVLPEVTQQVKSIMQSWPTLHGMPLKADLKVGKKFGSLGKYEPKEWQLKPASEYPAIVTAGPDGRWNVNRPT
jgi:uracil-DNA glycosylase family 4